MRKAIVLLAAVGIARGSSFMFSRLLLDTVAPFSLLAWRFLLAVPLLAIIFHTHLRNNNRQVLAHGCILGALYTAVMSFEMRALLHTATSTVSFLEHTAIVLVPLFETIVFRALPTRKAVLCTLAVMAGVALITLRDGFVAFGIGEAFGLCGATIYACAIIATARFAKRDDPLLLGIVQIASMGLLCLALALVFERPTLPASGMQWLYLGVLVLVCTVFGFTFQPVAQRYLSAQVAGLLCATNPLTAAVLGIAVLGEPATAPVFAGMALVIIGIMVTSVMDAKEADS